MFSHELKSQKFEILIHERIVWKRVRNYAFQRSSCVTKMVNEHFMVMKNFSKTISIGAIISFFMSISMAMMEKVSKDVNIS